MTVLVTDFCCVRAFFFNVSKNLVAMIEVVKIYSGNQMPANTIAITFPMSVCGVISPYPTLANVIRLK